jgi:EAL domain-containing protein (putative c-di-GMP-specific phosphodiesterase class I)
VDGDDRESRLTAAIIGLANVLDVRCVAEGVERPAQVSRLRELGCHEAQGFLLGRPMAPGALQELMTSQPHAVTLA